MPVSVDSSPKSALTSARPQTARQHAMRVLRVIVSLGLLGLMFAYAGVRDTLHAIEGLRAPLVLVAMLLLLLESLVRCFNWQQLCRAANLDISYGNITYSYFAGGFLGSFLPSTLSTDALRSALAASRSDGAASSYLGTVVALNLASLWTLGLVGLLACIWGLIHRGVGDEIVVLSLMTCLACVGLPIVLFSLAHAQRKPWRAVSSSARTSWRTKFSGVVERFAAAVTVVPTAKAMSSIVSVAVATYAFRTLVVFTLLWSANSPVAFMDLLFAGPILIISAVLPISIGGFGGQQAVTVYVLSYFSVSPQNALAVSLAYAFLYVILHALGSLAYAFAPTRARTGSPP